MTHQTIFKRLTHVDRHVQTLITELCMDDYWKPGDAITPNKSDPDDRFLFHKLNGLLSVFYKMLQGLTHLLKPSSGVHVSQIYPNGLSLRERTWRYDS